jgi:hypothetical protein
MTAQFAKTYMDAFLQQKAQIFLPLAPHLINRQHQPACALAHQHFLKAPTSSSNLLPKLKTQMPPLQPTN